MLLSGHYDREANIAAFAAEDRDPSRVLAEETDWGLREVDRDTGRLVGVELWGANALLPADVLELLPSPIVPVKSQPPAAATSP